MSPSPSSDSQNPEESAQVPINRADPIEPASASFPSRIQTGEKLAYGINKGDRIGPYQVIDFLGRGGFAQVFLGVDSLGKQVALKLGDVAGGGLYVKRLLEITSKRNAYGVSPDESPADAISFHENGARLKFLDKYEIEDLIRAEHQLLCKIKNKSVVKVMPELYSHDDRPVIAMNFERGKTLCEILRRKECVELHWFLGITRDLQKLHDSGEMSAHRDLKPENIIIKKTSATTKAMLIDPSPVIKNGKIFITSLHYNPLLYRDSRADVMGIGVMLYEILSGELPFDEVPWKYADTDMNEVKELELQSFLTYPPIKILPENKSLDSKNVRELNPNASDDLVRIVNLCLTGQPGYTLKRLEEDFVRFLKKKNP
ncbi:MAG: hypothetical protein SGJ02_04190 [bacterium]|nr:hypothetical protein [bacterium]